jgi:hypothetical protein
MNEFCVLGVDLAGVLHRTTGMCILRGLLFLQDKAEVYGNFADGAILMPKTVY